MTDPLSASHEAAGAREDAQVAGLLNWLSGAAILFLSGIGTKAWFAGHTLHAWVLWIFAVLVGLTIVQFSLTRNQPRQKASLIVIAALLFMYLVASGGESNTGPLWFYVFPPLLFFLTDLKTGTAVLLMCCLVAAIVFEFPQLPFVGAHYSYDFKIRFFATLAFESIFCFILEAGRLKARNELVELAATHEHAARTDELTGLSNRRDMQQRLAEEFSRYQRSGHHFSVVLIDLDLFKKINDVFGHDAGDSVLRQFSGVLSEVVRKTDSGARWGGEEFLLLLPNTSLLQALTLAERLRQRVASTSFVFRNQTLPVTLSAGVCSIANSATLADLLKQVDLHLYNAKQAGRNRIAPRVRQSEDGMTTST
ncbi:diguanylate cyclase [Marinobacter santoriniensis NKSG1]|uniref:diguanylate cyclase n=1 Tax=Marinobacter santoriniensis NKSG1 TaxID=1288826 RepID=M7CMV4_9GAMM|nr:GGDEF domain-containing protein [Marinobacter santoriniensis]EMP54956.1 diguanylate cyclase [Marinobacter santoriniensis NKSG1]